MSQHDGVIDIVWLCGQDERCMNKNRPRTHTDYTEAACCATGEPQIQPIRIEGVE